MDFISYRGMPMRIIETIGVNREPMLDKGGDSTYVFTKWTGDLVTTYNPGALSARPNGAPGAVPFVGVPNNSPLSGLPGFASINPGTMPAFTDATIRAFLEQPRGRLIISSLGQTVLDCPTVNGILQVCDANNGPKVRVNSIQEVAGERMWRIHLTFEAAVNETPTPRVIVSNRWAASSRVSWQHTAERVIRGVCTVRGDLLRNAAFVAAPNTGLIDSLRNAFASFSLPPNYQRTGVDVVVSPDGNSAAYTVTDTEQVFQKPGLVNTNVPRFEVKDTNWMWRGSWGKAAQQLSNQGMSAYMPSWWSYLIPVPGAPWLAPAMSAFFNSTQATLQATAAQMPKRYMNCLVRAWGNRLQYRPQLTNLAMAIAAARLGQAAFFDTTTQEIVVSGDTSNYVDVSWTISWEYQTNIAGFPIGLFGIPLGPGVGGAGDRSFAGAIAQDTNMPTVADARNLPPGLTGPPVITQTSGNAVNNPPFPGDSGTRGTDTALGRLVIQVLEAFDAAPAAPT